MSNRIFVVCCRAIILFMNKSKQHHSNQRASKIHQKKIRRKRKLAVSRAAFELDRAKSAQMGEEDPILNSLHEYRARLRAKLPRPPFSETIKCLATQINAFSPVAKVKPIDNVFDVPTVFSLSDNCAESFAFLQHLFVALYAHQPIRVYIDYQYCKRIDLDASVVLDVILGEFIQNMRACYKTGHRTTRSVGPINYGRSEIMEILFSIGSYRILKGWSMDFPGIIPFPLRVGTFSEPGQREVDNTELVSYISKCLGQCERTLTGDAEKELSEIIGEVLANAEEHSTTRRRYLIGYFKLNKDQVDSLGTFNLVVFNFGDTIYEKFKDPACQNQETVNQMRSLSTIYTERGFFARFLGKQRFEEESLWTLYALQQGVTRYKDWERGNGTMEFIESFFALKGDNLYDDTSRLTLFSGNTRIIFDGSYAPKTSIRVNSDGIAEEVKVMTFNRSGDIREQPDPRFVNFANEFFPGTMISAKICIKPSNTEIIDSNHESATH